MQHWTSTQGKRRAKKSRKRFFAASAPNTPCQEGWTIVELMVVVLVVGILAAVAIPIYQANIQRSKASEADAALGVIRTALRVHFAENGSYPIHASYTRVDSVGLDLKASDLAGTYFSISDYKYQSADGINYLIRATGSGSQAGINRQLDQDGILANF